MFPSAGEYLSTSPNGDHSELLLLAVVVEQVESSEEYKYGPRDDRHAILRGDPVLVVRGTVQNRHRTYTQIGMHAAGLDETGERVSYTLDASYLPGTIALNIEPGEIGEFLLHMNAADNLKTIISTESPLRYRCRSDATAARNGTEPCASELWGHHTHF